MKICQFCKEEIQDDAVKCKHCGEFMTKHQSDMSFPTKVVYGIILFMVGFLGYVWIQGLSLSNLIYNLFGIRL